VLPILHLNGYKIANPTVLARIPQDELRALLEGYGTRRASSRATTRRRCTSDGRDARRALDEIRAIQRAPRDGRAERPRWPMIVLRTPKGWTGPEGGRRRAAEGTFRSHQVPLAAARDARAPRAARGVDALLPARGAVRRARRAAPELPRSRPRASAHGRQPARQRRPAAARPATARLPRLRRRRSPRRRRRQRGDARARRFLRDVDARNPTPSGVRADETPPTASAPVFDVTDARGWPRSSPATTPRPDGRSWRCSASTSARAGSRAILLTGRHGFFSCYEAFIHIVDSMFNQHAKWLKVTRDIPWRRRSRR
jgi:xylulose-5-phosphate/fructose-6-phosphate phosphoketolase